MIRIIFRKVIKKTINYKNYNEETHSKLPEIKNNVNKSHIKMSTTYVLSHNYVLSQYLNKHACHVYMSMSITNSHQINNKVI